MSDYFIIVLAEGEENEGDVYESGISQSESVQSGSENSSADIQIIDQHFTLLEQQLTGIICFFGVFLGVFLISKFYDWVRK